MSINRSLLTALAASATLAGVPAVAQADLVIVSMQGDMQDIDDPTNLFGGGTRFSATTIIDTDTTVITNTSSGTTRYYSGIQSFQVGSYSSGPSDSRLQITNGSPDDIDQTFDVLAFGAFAALDFDGNAIDALDLPVPGLTFDGFTPNVVGARITIDESNATGTRISEADIVVDTITVTPSPASVSLIGLAGMACVRCRRRS